MQVPWHEAHESISRALQARREAPDQAVVVGIGGRVGAGKSTLAARLSSCILATDNYLPDYEGVPYHERDQPHHADFDRLAADLAALREGRPIHAPVWSYQTHRREGVREITPAPVIVCEGIHALHGKVALLHDLRVFVEAPRETRWSRWEMLERTGQRGWGVEKAREYFDQVAEPTFAASEHAYRACADLIVVNG